VEGRVEFCQLSFVLEIPQMEAHGQNVHGNEPKESTSVPAVAKAVSEAEYFKYATLPQNGRDVLKVHGHENARVGDARVEGENVREPLFFDLDFCECACDKGVRWIRIRVEKVHKLESDDVDEQWEHRHHLEEQKELCNKQTGVARIYPLDINQKVLRSRGGGGGGGDFCFLN